MRILFYTNLLLVILTGFSSCSNNADSQAENTAAEPQTPVTVTSVSFEPLVEYLELNATSTFLQRSYIKASTNGYLQTVSAQIGKTVSAGQILFNIITKEAKSIGNSINNLDPGFRFSGLNSIRSNAYGFVSEVSHQKGDYVQEGEPLAVITNANSFVFLLDLPYELKQVAKLGKPVDVMLPDGENYKGYISSFMPVVDSVSQTQRVVIKVKNRKPIPENLIAKVRLVKDAQTNRLSLPKNAVLTNETEDEFWVMELLDDTTAIKVPVKKGIETADRVQILSPSFTTSDRIVLSGNYGLADTARVKIVH
jgi:multidrug efflux pump subunit AcrA (membrane-fusion protein)